MKAEFYRDSQGQHRWRVVAANGEIVAASSQGFMSERNARSNLDLLARYLKGVSA